MPKIKIELEIEIDKPLRSAEDGRYLCASIEEGVSYGWHDFMLNQEVFPQSARSVSARITADDSPAFAAA